MGSLTVDNPFRATDLAYTSTAVPGGPAQARFSTSPDNEASRGAFGGQLKFGRQTRIGGDVAFGTWTQNENFLPYTINSAIFTPAGAPANALSTLQRPSLDGKVEHAVLQPRRSGPARSRGWESGCGTAATSTKDKTDR